eukprot:m.54651 g.54651  ORF g.54651 m.54651 type:complete len:630 (-) comp12473_c0_seq1:165-2054(-)
MAFVQRAVLSVVLVLGAVAAASSSSAAGWPSTEPFWPHYPLRKLQVLDGQWQFGLAAQGVPDVINVQASEASTPNTTTVPSAFDVTPPGEPAVRGTAFYRTHFDLTPNTEGLVYFAACAFYCKVFVDGKSLGDHRAGGYQPFWLKVPASSSSVRELLVVSDNRFNSTTAPTTTGGDFYFFGGIIRNVIVHELPSKTYIHQVETIVTDYKGKINVDVVLGGDTSLSSVNLRYAFDGGEAATKAVDVADGVAHLGSLVVPNAKPWTMATPNLHTLAVSISSSNENDAADTVVVRFGLRVLGVDKATARLTINDEIVKLHGYNRHTLWPDTGSAVNLNQIKIDVALLKEVGANYVRGAHYPQDQRFLDLCDSEGIAIWEETLGPGVSVSDLTNPYFMKYQVEAVNEMVSASFNHPSVIFHAFYNEGPSERSAACPGYNTSASTIRKRLGKSRFVTWASNQQIKDVCLDIADVVSFNGYPAWYDKSGDIPYTKEFWKKMADWVRENHNKPFTISETGAGGVYEWNDNQTNVKWSQEYQNAVVKDDAEFAMDNDNVTGLTLWQFSDIKVDSKCPQCVYYPHPQNLSVPWNCEYIDVSCGRPGGENHKGSVDIWRRKKQVFDTVKAIYQAAAGNN